MVGVISETDRIGFILEAQNAQDRTEQLRVDDAQILPRAFNNRWLIKETVPPRVPFAATEKLAAFSLGVRHFPLDAFELSGSAKRAHFGRVIQWVADLDLLNKLRHVREEVISDVFLQIQPRSRDAALARCAEDCRNRTVNRAFHIRVIKHDKGRFPAKFQRDLGEMFSRIDQHLPRRGRSSGK